MSHFCLEAFIWYSDFLESQDDRDDSISRSDIILRLFFILQIHLMLME